MVKDCLIEEIDRLNYRGAVNYEIHISVIEVLASFSELGLVVRNCSGPYYEKIRVWTDLVRVCFWWVNEEMVFERGV